MISFDRLRFFALVIFLTGSLTVVAHLALNGDKSFGALLRDLVAL